MPSEPTDIRSRLRAAHDLLSQDRRAEAAIALRELLQAAPQDHEVLRANCLFLAGSGRVRDAEQLMAAALRALPPSADLACLGAEILLVGGRYEAAAQALRQICEKSPGHLLAHLRLGDALMALQQPREANLFYHTALQIRSGDAAALVGSARAITELGDRPRAMELYREALRSDPRNVDALCGLAWLVRIDGEFGTAEHLYQRAREAEPNNPRPLIGQAELLAGFARWDEADALLTRVLEDFGPSGEAAQVLATVAPNTGRVAEAIAVLEQLVNDPACPPSNRARLRSSLGALHEKAGDYEKAIASYRAGNDEIRVDADPNFTDAYVARLRSVFARDDLVRLPRSGSPSRMPVFIVGMPRSGTSLIEQILSSHSQLHGGGEMGMLPDLRRRITSEVGGALPFPECLRRTHAAMLERLANEYLGELGRLGGGKPFVSDKLPTNFFLVGLIWMLFPNARVIHCIRDPLDTCLSCYTSPLPLQLSYRFRFDTLGRYYQAYRRIMDHWKQTLDLPILDVVYEQVVADTEPQVRRILDFCGMPWEDACLRFHESQRITVTASRDQVRRPIYRSSVSRAARFGHHLDGLREALGPYAPAQP